MCNDPKLPEGQRLTAGRARAREDMASRIVRRRGMESPYAKDQISAFVLHPIISAGFVALCALSLKPVTLAIVLSPFVVLNVIVAGLWSYISWTDPAGEGGCPIRSKSSDSPHYCSYCRKSVKGFDHHCSWLNTCISARNYSHFYFLGVSGSFLYIYMTTMGALALRFVDNDEQRDGFGTLTAFRVAWGVLIAIAGWVGFSFLTLAGFHTYLLCVGLGTYDWVVLQNQKRQQKLAAKRNGEAPTPWYRRCCAKTNHQGSSSATVREQERHSISSRGRRAPANSTSRETDAETGMPVVSGKKGEALPLGGGGDGAEMDKIVMPTKSGVATTASMSSNGEGLKAAKEARSSTAPEGRPNGKVAGTESSASRLNP